jgi:hypothetical protein
MKKSDYYALMAVVVLTPHMWPGVAAFVAVCALLVAGIAAVREYRGLPE